jgi:glutamate/tyrosine decarboxylase-like PLP-dependent enzyme
MLAIRAHYNYFGKRRGISYPEIVCCSTAHAAVDKACDAFGIRKVCIPCDPVTFTLSVQQVRKHLTSNTILIYASAPCYPQGVIDPIQQLGKLAMQFGIGLHVDACLGGFVLPFAKQLGYDIPAFDFECEGVTSMSVDTHKYGYASKGTSVVLYRTKELRHGQYFSYSKWSGM